VTRLRKTARLTIWVLAIALLVPGFYILSFGPVCYIAVNTHLLSSSLTDLIEEFYAPLEEFSCEDHSAAKLLRSYIRLWGVPVPEPGHRPVMDLPPEGRASKDPSRSGT
jgi:hypothetical protein